MLGIVLPGGICRVPPSLYMPPSPLLVGVPGSLLAGWCQRVRTGEHELSRGDVSYFRGVEERRLSAGERGPFSPQK